MTIESLVYALLSGASSLTSIVGSQILPVYPTQDSALPFLVYAKTGTESFPSFTGPGLRRYDVELQYWTINEDQNVSIAEACRTLLDGYRDSNIQGCFLQENTAVQEEYYYHGSQTYSVFSTV